MKAMTLATPWTAIRLNGSGSPPNSQRSEDATAGSPSQPSPRLARVMPSWWPRSSGEWR